MFFIVSSISNSLTKVNKLDVKVKFYPQCTVHDLPLCCAAVPCVRMRLRDLKLIISKKASSISVPKNVLSFTSLDIKQMDAETLYTRLFLCSQLVCYDCSVGLLHAGRMQHT